MAACDCQRAREAVVLMDVAPRRPDNRPNRLSHLSPTVPCCCNDMSTTAHPHQHLQLSLLSSLPLPVRQHWQAGTSNPAFHTKFTGFLRSILGEDFFLSIRETVISVEAVLSDAIFAAAGAYLNVVCSTFS